MQVRASAIADADFLQAALALIDHQVIFERIEAFDGYVAAREARDYIVTLGDSGDIDPARRIATMRYAHPAYTRESVAAQRRLPGLNTTVTAFAGAYHGWGFHEDGCRSGAAAARALGGSW